MTPQQLAMTPAAPPPPGVIPDFQQPATRISELLGVGILFLSVATALVGVRIYMKAIVLKKWKIEDSKSDSSVRRLSSNV